MYGVWFVELGGIMRILNGLIMASALVAGTLAAAVPASATVTTFAQYTQASGSNSRTLDWRQIGTGGRLCTIATATGSCPASLTSGTVTTSVDVKFSFLESGIGNSGPISAKLILDLVASAGHPAQTMVIPGVGTVLVQSGLSGSFSIVADTPFTYGTVTGSNLLSGTIAGATISGFLNSSSGSVNGSTLNAQTVVYNSDFLNFDGTANRDFALTLTAINPALARSSTTGPLRSFRAAGTGSFSSDPAPAVNGVPEAATWAMMLVGFGMAGSAMRKRRRADVFA